MNIDLSKYTKYTMGVDIKFEDLPEGSILIPHPTEDAYILVPPKSAIQSEEDYKKIY